MDPGVGLASGWAADCTTGGAPWACIGLRDASVLNIPATGACQDPALTQSGTACRGPEMSWVTAEDVVDVVQLKQPLVPFCVACTGVVTGGLSEPESVKKARSPRRMCNQCFSQCSAINVSTDICIMVSVTSHGKHCLSSLGAALRRLHRDPGCPIFYWRVSRGPLTSTTDRNDDISSGVDADTAM